MSDFSEHWARVAGKLTDHFSQSLSYTDSTLASPVSIDVRLSRETQVRRKDDMGGWKVVTTRTARYVTADVDSTIRLDGTATIGTREYSIDHIADVEGGETELALIRAEAGEVTSPHYRGRQ